MQCGAIGISGSSCLDKKPQKNWKPGAPCRFVSVYSSDELALPCRGGRLPYFPISLTVFSVGSEQRLSCQGQFSFLIVEICLLSGYTNTVVLPYMQFHFPRLQVPDASRAVVAEPPTHRAALKRRW